MTERMPYTMVIGSGEKGLLEGRIGFWYTAK